MRAAGLLLSWVGGAALCAAARGVETARGEDAYALDLGWLPVLDAWERFAELLPAAVALGLGCAAVAAIATGLARLSRVPRLVGGALVLAALGAAAVFLPGALARTADPAAGGWRRFLWDQRLLVQGEPLVSWVGFAGAAAALLALGGAWRREVPRVRSLLVPALPALVLAAVGIAGALHRGSPADRGGKHLFLVVLDTVAASRMASYGHETVTTPELDALGERGVRFDASYSVAPWTLPSHASMFTGLHPIRHGATQETLVLARSFPTLAEILGNAGYRTFAAVNNAVVADRRQLDQGFSTFLAMRRRDASETYRGRGRHPTNAAVAELLDGLGEGERAFVFVNYIEAHFPYAPPEERARPFLAPEWTYDAALGVDQRWERHYGGQSDHGEHEWRALRGLYDGELADLSATVADLVGLIDERGLLDDSLVLVTSDHGENLGDHGHLDHVFSLHDTLLRVPLFALGGGLPAGVVRTDPVSSTDLFYTLLAAGGCEPRGDAPQGRDLFAPGAEEVSVPLVAEYYYPRSVLSVLREHTTDEARLAPFLRRMRSVRDGDWKLVASSDGRRELYHLGRDPSEEHDLAAEEPDRVRELEALLRARLEAFAGRPLDALVEDPGELGPLRFGDTDAEALDELRRLGYAE